MKVAIIGSRNLRNDMLECFVPPDVTEIVSGGALGIDTCAKEFALKNDYPYKEFLPDYKKYGRAAPIRRNDLIIDYSDLVLAFWDGKSAGTKYVIDRCKEIGKPIKAYINNRTSPPE